MRRSNCGVGLAEDYGARAGAVLLLSCHLRVEALVRALVSCVALGLDVASRTHGLDVVDALCLEVGTDGLDVAGGDADVVLDLFDRVRAVGVLHEHATASGVGRPALAATDVPGVADHELKVVVVVDGRAHVGVVAHKLARVHLTVLLAAIKRVQELEQHLVLGLAALQHIGVLLGAVLGLDVVEVHDAASIRIQDLERRQNQLRAALVELTAHSQQELVKVHAARVVRVNEVEQLLHLLLAQLQRVLADSLAELVQTQRAVAVVVNDAELASQSANAFGSVLVERVPQDLQRLQHRLGPAQQRGGQHVAATYLERSRPS
ncbi:hypothetical protein ON010_g16119 [Phytophthora cinnamomi]|nr:hypothetical protein ON010_g16119 [Phytophthora cinnamomi]